MSDKTHIRSQEGQMNVKVVVTNDITVICVDQKVHVKVERGQYAGLICTCTCEYTMFFADQYEGVEAFSQYGVTTELFYGK